MTTANITGNFHVSRGQSRSKITSPIQSKMDTMNPIRAIRAILLMVAVCTGLHAQLIRFDSTVITSNSACSPGSLCPALLVPGATVSLYTSAALSAPATTYTDITGGTACPTFAQITLPGTLQCVSASNNSGNFGFWVQQGTYYYQITYPAVVGSGTTVFAFTAGAAGIAVAGSDTQVQYNRMGVFGADAGNSWNYTSGILHLTTSAATGGPLLLDTASIGNQVVTIYSRAGSSKWAEGLVQSGSVSNDYILQDLSTSRNFLDALQGGSLNISPSSGLTNFLGNAGTPSIFAANGSFIQASGGFFSSCGSGNWQCFNTQVDGALMRGYHVQANVFNTSGGYIDVVPITYHPYLGSACFDANGNAVQQPLPLPGLSGFGATDVLLWVGTSPSMPPSGSCGAPLPIEEDVGLNSNGYAFFRGGLATDNQHYNAINTVYLSGGVPAGGVEAGSITAGTLYPAGTVTTTGTLSVATYLGGYIAVGKSNGPPAIGTIASVTNPYTLGDGTEAGTIYYDTGNDCLEVAANSLTFACIAGGGGGSGTVSSSAQFNIPYYTTNPTGTVVGGNAAFSFNPGGTPQVTLLGNFQTTGAAFGFDASTCTAANCIQAPLGGISSATGTITNFSQWAEVTAPGLSAANQCRIYDDPTAHNLLLSCNAGPYAAIGGGSGSGTVGSSAQFNIAYYTTNPTGTTVGGNAAWTFSPTGGAGSTPQVSLAGNILVTGASFGFDASTCTLSNCIQAPLGGISSATAIITNFSQWAEVTAPGLSAANQCRIYDDPTAHNLLLSCNAGPYTAIGGGGGSGTVNAAGANQVAFYASAGNVVSGSSNLAWNNTSRLLAVFSASPSVAGILESTGFIQSDAGFLASVGCAGYNCVQTQGGGMLAKSFTAFNYVQTGHATTTPAVTSGDSFAAGAMYYNTTVGCEEVYGGIAFACIGGAGGTTVNTFSGAISLVGTSNQITVTNASNTITLSLPATVTTTLFNSSATGSTIGLQVNSGTFSVNGNGAVSAAGVGTFSGGLNVTGSNAANSIQSTGGIDVCDVGGCSAGVAMQVNGANVMTLSGGLLTVTITGLFNSTASGASVAFQSGGGNFQVNGNGAGSFAGVVTTSAGFNVITTTATNSIQSPGGANLCNAGTCSSGNALSIDGTPVFTVSGGIASETLAGTLGVASAATFNGGLIAGTSTNSTLHIGTGNFYTRTTSASTGISCSGIADGWLAVTSDNFAVVCLGGSRFRAALSSY